MHPESLNYYQVLDVSPEASQDNIFEAYQKAQKTFSLSNPNIYEVFTNDEAKAWLDLIDEAYSVIGYPNTRRAYDQEINLTPSLNADFESSDTKAVENQTFVEEDNAQEGYESTKVSSYKLDPAMEEKIENQAVFDGIFLKKIREYKNIDLPDFSKHTCIAIRHLYAIENNNFSVLPAAVFVRGYIIQYCRTLGLDEDIVVPSFMALLKNV